MVGYYRELHNSVGVFICKTPDLTWFLSVTILGDKSLFIKIDRYEVIKLVCGQCPSWNPRLVTM